jgi:hypothetical protein
VSAEVEPVEVEPTESTAFVSAVTGAGASCKVAVSPVVSVVSDLFSPPQEGKLRVARAIKLTYNTFFIGLFVLG